MEKAVGDRRGKASGVLFSTLSDKLSDNMKIIAVPGWESVQSSVSALARKRPEWFPQGFDAIHAVSNPEFFAAVDGATIYFSNADEQVPGFKPAALLAQAMAKAKKGEALSFNEEYAVETLWHEMLHNQGGHANMPKRDRERSSIEGVVQFTSRHTYHALASELGISHRHQNAIITGGLAYAVEVGNLRVLLAKLGIDGWQAAERLNGLFASQAEPSAIIGETAGLLSEMSAYSADRIAVILKWLSLESGFRQKAEKKLAY